MADFEIIVRTGGGKPRELATGVPPDLDDGDLLSVSPQEAAETVFTLAAPSGGTATLDELKTKGATEIIFRRPGKKDIVKPISFLEGKLTEYKKFKSESPHAVTLTIPAAKDIDPLTKKGVKKPEEHELAPLKRHAGETLTFQIKIPEGHDYHTWTPELSERLMTAIDESDYSSEFKSALKIAARNGTLGPKLKVKLGFKETNLQQVLGEADLRKAEKAEEEESAEAEGEGYGEEGGVPHTSDPHFNGLNFVNAVSSFFAAINFVSKLAARLSSLCDWLIGALAGGDTDIIALLNDLRSGIEGVLASKTAIETDQNKKKIRQQIIGLRAKHEEAQKKYRETLAKVNQNPKDSALAAKLAEYENTTQRINYLLQDAQAFMQTMDHFVQAQIQASQDSKRMADVIRYKLDNGRRNS